MRSQCAALRLKEFNGAVKLNLVTKQFWTPFFRPVMHWLKRPKMEKAARKHLLLQPNPQSELSQTPRLCSRKSAGLPGFRNAARDCLIPVHRSAPNYFVRLPNDWLR